jgi:hypothetical protein
MYCGITKIFDTKNGRTRAYETCPGRRNNLIPPKKLLFMLYIVHISAARRRECMHKNIDEPVLTGVWQELEYRIDVCRVTRGAHIEHL